MATLEAVVAADADPATTREAIKHRLAERFAVDHATVEIHIETEASIEVPDDAPVNAPD